jgi:mRNA-degrading endonuclease RelE of RelBE toxin-antitoxin system
MSYKIQPTPVFHKSLKKLSKKYRSIKEDLFYTIRPLKEGELIGSKVYKNCYKCRIHITSKGKGKSSGARMIYYVRTDEG